MTNRTKSEFTSHCQIAAKTNFLMLLSFPARFAHARYSSRMIDRFLNWGDHGEPKSGKIKGRCQPPLVMTICSFYQFYANQALGYALTCLSSQLFKFQSNSCLSVLRQRLFLTVFTCQNFNIQNITKNHATFNGLTSMKNTWKHQRLILKQDEVFLTLPLNRVK